MIDRFKANLNGTITASASLLALFFYIQVSSTYAVNHADSCNNKYENLSKQHTAAIMHNTEGTPAFFNALHSVEEKIFISFQHCPKDPLLFTLMGEVQISLGNLQLASIYANKAFNWNSTIWQTHHLLGTTLSMQEQYEKGLIHLEQAADMAKDKAILIFNLCSTYLAAKAYEKAIKVCTKLIQRKDHELHGPAFYIRSKSYHALDKTELAKQDLKKAQLLGFTQPDQKGR